MSITIKHSTWNFWCTCNVMFPFNINRSYIYTTVYSVDNSIMSWLKNTLLLKNDKHYFENLEVTVVTSKILITDHHNRYNNNEKLEVLWELPKCDTDKKWANAIQENGVIDILNVGLPHTFDGLQKIQHLQGTIKQNKVYLYWTSVSARDGKANKYVVGLGLWRLHVIGQCNKKWGQLLNL